MFKQELLESNRQLQDSNATLTTKVKSLEDQLAALQALLLANQTFALEPHYLDKVNIVHARIHMYIHIRIHTYSSSQKSVSKTSAWLAEQFVCDDSST